MLLGQRIIPMGVDLDTSTRYLTDRSYFLKGIETGWLTQNGKAENSMEAKPAESNFLYCSVTLPAGINKIIGFHFYKEENTGYCVVWNSNGYHLVYRIKGADATGEIVYRFCRNFPGITNKPKDFFAERRMAIKSLCRFLPDGTSQLFKILVLVNKKVDNLQIVVEDSIATNSFTTPFFNQRNPCKGDLCRIVKTGVPTPMAYTKVVPITPTDADKLKQNLMLQQMFQFRFVHENAWGQRSEHGIISQPYFNNLSGCSRDASGQPHCVWLETQTPSPEIVRVTVEVRSCQLRNGAGTDGNVLSNWKEAYHVDLYDKTNANLNWYERKYDINSTEFQFFNDGKNIRYKFCNNRECKPIALADIRSQNPAPINSGTVASIGKAFAYGNNENDLGPMLKEDIEAVKFALTPTEACEQKFSRIKVYAIIHNFFDNQNNPVHLRGGKVSFGGFGQDPTIGDTKFEEQVSSPETTLSNKGGHGQYFPDGVKGFRGRLAGTNFTAESKQYLWNYGNLEELGVLSDDLERTRKMVSDNGWGRRYFIQEFDFGMVPNGIYSFQMNGHNDTEDIENTSTYYIHTTTFGLYNQHWGMPQNYQKEILIDTTAGNDYITRLAGDPLAVIADLTAPKNIDSVGSRVVRGYLMEGRTNKIPIELAEVKFNNGAPTGGVHSGYTDHNGFYFAVEWTRGSAFSRLNYKVQLFSSNKCTFGFMVAQTGNKTAEGTTLHEPMYAEDKSSTYVTDACNRYVVKGIVSECVAGGGIEGIVVKLGRTKHTYTNSKGEFKIIAHYLNGRGSDKVIMSVGGSCFVLDCACKPIAVNLNTNQPVCTVCIENTIDIGTFHLKTILTYGMPHGSRIPLGLKAYDWAGRHTDIQTTETMYLDFPTEQEQKNATYPKIMVTLPQRFSADFCRRFSRLTVNWGKNINFDDFFTWAADDVTFIDSSGEKNESNPSKIKIWWRSLNGYNLLRGGNTNTNWTFLNSVMDSKGSQLVIDNQPVYNTKLGDTVEFIQDADGKYFPPNTQANVQYDQQGTYFLIDFDDTLRGLKPGAKFRIKRPYQCEVQKTFYEYSFPINFCKDDCVPRDDDGNVITSFELKAFASYMLPRQIPVVRDVETVVETSSGDGVSALKNIIVSPIVNKLLGWNQDNAYTIKEVKTTEVKKNTSFPYAFEHHSPSDSWGDHCNSGGRVGYINPYEKKRCDRTQILITGGLNQQNDGAVNYLHYFSLQEEFVLDEEGFGAIQALVVRNDQQVLVICDFRTFTFRFNDNRVVVTEQGYIAVPTNRRFSKPESNPHFELGCQAQDINTIRTLDGLVTFLDASKQQQVLHDFVNAYPISIGIESWLVPAIKDVNANPDTKYFHTCFDAGKKVLYLTKFDLAAEQYGNDKIGLDVSVPETFCYNYISKQWRMAHFTPEYFGALNGDEKDIQFFSFKDALPYAHHNAVNPGTVYLNYFGVQYFPVIGVVTNIGPTQEKSFISTIVHCREQLFIIEELETSIGQKSKVYEDEWEWAAGVSFAPYLCDTEFEDDCAKDVNDMLFDGDTLYGHWMKALYIPEPGYAGEFFMLTAIESNYINRSTGK